jgi:hypothetical protein
MCIRRERILRIQFPDEKFAPEDEAILSRLSLDHPDDCFIRYQHLIGLWHAWEHRLRKANEAGSADVASEMLLARVPVRIRIADRVVDITSRSRAALIRLAMHDEARQFLGDKLDWIARERVQIDVARTDGAVGPLAAIRRRRVLNALAKRIGREWEAQWRGVLANCATPDGAAALPEDAPDWWDRVTAEDEQRIMWALAQHVERYIEASKRRQRKPEKPGEKSTERVSFGVFLRMLEGKLRLPPMALEDTDLLRAIHAADLGVAEAAGNADLEEVFAA